jgi:hypothetical protein
LSKGCLSLPCLFRHDRMSGGRRTERRSNASRPRASSRSARSTVVPFRRSTSFRSDTWTTFEASLAAAPPAPGRRCRRYCRQARVRARFLDGALDPTPDPIGVTNGEIHAVVARKRVRPPLLALTERRSASRQSEARLPRSTRCRQGLGFSAARISRRRRCAKRWAVRKAADHARHNCSLRFRVHSEVRTVKTS